MSVYSPKYTRNYTQVRQYFLKLARKLARRIGDKHTLTELKGAEDYTIDKLIDSILRLDKASMK